MTALLHIAGLAVTSLLAIAPAPTTSQPTTQPNPAELVRVIDLGKRDVRIHDPSTIVHAGDRFYLFGTGFGIVSFSSPDLRTWTAAPRVFEKPLPWFADVAPGNRGHLWAPDVIRLDDEHGERWLLYYSVSSLGKRTSAIALATNTTLDPASPNYLWRDAGIVIRTSDRDEFNAIDPSVMRDADGRLWLSFGSFWSGIRLIELDPKTGLRKDAAAPVRLAYAREIEASCLFAHDGRYYLFVNWGQCCKGVKSTYEIRVGRSEKIDGPYLDRDGKPLLDGGGTLVLASDGPMIGPGHAGIFRDADGREQFSFHFYDATEAGAPRLGVRPLAWDDAGWPVVKEAAR